MTLEEVIKARRSTRKYSAEKQVTEAQIKTLVEAALLAPSWKNSQTARYYVILDQEKCAKFREECLPPFNAKNCENAALIVAAYVTKRAGFDREGNPDNELGDVWGAYDLGLANENILLCAKDLGLDTLVMGIRDEAKVRVFCEVPEDQCIVSVISVGYGEDPHNAPKRKEAEDVLKFL